jgi:hypothetical protein
MLLKRYWKWAFNLSRLLEPFFPHANVNAFRQILQKSGGIISSSAALQFLDRRIFDGASGLDIYVPFNHASTIADWLRHHGLTESVPECTNIDVVSNYDYSNEIKHVSTFIAVDSTRVIQLISTNRNPAFAVIDFHSSTSFVTSWGRGHTYIVFLACVMNFISHDTVYSLYPVSTFSDRRSLVWGVPSPSEREAACKYERRGWAVYDFLDISIMTGRPLELGTGTRHIGDSMSWTFNIDSGDEGAPWLIDGDVFAWSVTYSKLRVGQNGQGIGPSLLELGMFTLNHTDLIDSD